MTSSTADARYMARALELGRKGLYSTHPNPRVGCVIVNAGEIVGEGWHEHAGEPHAEVLALRAAGARARGATAYVTLEPCCHVGRTGPCSSALIAAGVGRVVAAMQDPNPKVSGSGFAALKQAGIEVDIGVMEAEAGALNRGFVSRMQRGRPWVRLKLAMSLDGRTAAADGGNRWITGEAAREDVHRLRAECGAVLTSSATVLADDSLLTVRLPGDWRQPDRIVLDSAARVPASAKVWNDDGARKIWLVSEAARPAGVSAQTLRISSRADGRLDLGQALRQLAQLEVGELLVECGPQLAGALLEAQLVDELIVYVAPILLGDAAPGLAHLPQVRALAQGLAFDVADVRAFGPDWRITATPRVRQ